MTIYYRRKYTLSTNHFATAHDELIESYGDLFKNTEIRFSAKLKYTRIDRVIGNYNIQRGSATYAFSLITNFGIHYVCAVIISKHNQVFFSCKSTLNKEFKKIHSAQTVIQCIKILKTKGTLKPR